MRVFVIGSSITSTYWNGAATYYRGIYKHLSRLGHSITFAEPDVYGRQKKRDFESLDYVDVRVYHSPEDIPEVLQQACEADLVIKHSGVGAEDERLECEVLLCGSSKTKIAFWDVDAPATLSRAKSDATDPFRSLIPKYDFIFTYGGGLPVVADYLSLGARNCHPIYNALDPDTHHPIEPDPVLQCDLAFVGNRLPDREKRVEDFFLKAASLAPELSFILGGEGWGNKTLPANVRWIGHVGSGDHNRVNCSARMVLNLNRDSMASVGFSPPTRVFEAAGAGACLISDAWPGIGSFFVRNEEILIASSAEEIVSFLRSISPAKSCLIGAAMRSHALREHTYQLRASEVDRILHNSFSIDVLQATNKDQLESSGRLQTGA